MTRFPRDIMSVQKSTSEVGRFSTTSSPAAQNCSISMTSKGDIYTKKSPILNLQKSWVVNLCPFYRMVKVWIRFGHRWISGHIVKYIFVVILEIFIYKYIFVVILEVFWKKFQMVDSKKSTKIAPFISQLSWRVLKFWRRENFFQVKSYRSSCFWSRVGQYCWL